MAVDDTLRKLVLRIGEGEDFDALVVLDAGQLECNFLLARWNSDVIQAVGPRFDAQVRVVLRPLTDHHLAAAEHHAAARALPLLVEFVPYRFALPAAAQPRQRLERGRRSRRRCGRNTLPRRWRRGGPCGLRRRRRRGLPLRSASDQRRDNTRQNDKQWLPRSVHTDSFLIAAAPAAGSKTGSSALAWAASFGSPPSPEKAAVRHR